MLLANANVDGIQRISVLAAAAPLSIDSNCTLLKAHRNGLLVEMLLSIAILFDLQETSSVCQWLKMDHLIQPSKLSIMR